MRATHVYATLALLAAAALSRAAAAGPPPKRRRSPSACRIWCGWSASRSSRYPPTASASPTPYAPPIWMRTRGAPAIWLLDTRKRNASAVRITDLSANSNAAEWSGDGRFVYYLSNRSGSTQVWRAAPGGEPLQVTNLPLDVGSFRVARRRSPAGERRGVPRLRRPRVHQGSASTPPRTAPARGVLYDRMFVRHWDTWSDGRRSQLFSIALDASGHRRRNARQSDRRASTATCPASRSAAARIMRSARTARQVAFSVRAVPAGEPWSTNFDIYPVPAGGGAAHTSPPTIRRGTRSRPSRPTARCSPISRSTGPDSNPTACIWCCSI